MNAYMSIDAGLFGLKKRVTRAWCERILLGKKLAKFL